MKQPRAHNRRQRGITLIEALVSMAVMAIGMLGLVGVQSTLRSNSDVAKQRAEALRFAQEGIEEWRAYVTLASPPPPGRLSYAQIVTDSAPSTREGSSAVYSRTRVVAPMLAGGLQGKEVSSRVTWTDRKGDVQSVRLDTTITLAQPVLAGTLHVPPSNSDYQTPQGRNRAIPQGARTFPSDRRYSGFIPPGAATGVAWRFDNVSGVITVCRITDSSVASSSDLDSSKIDCTSGTKALLISGIVRFANSMSVQPTPTEARAANGTIGSVEGGFAVKFLQTKPDILADGGRLCNAGVVRGAENYIQYFCAVPNGVGAESTLPISGYVWIDGGSLIADAASEPSNSLRRVCRYFANRGYTLIEKPLSNQNLLVMAAGDGTNPFTCTIPSTPPQVTWPHQPL